MSFQKKSFYLFLGAWILLTALALYNLSLQPGLPFTPQEGTDGISIGDTLTVNTKKTSYVPLIVDIDGIPAASLYDIEAIIDSKKIGEKVTINLSDNSALKYYLIPHNDFWFVFLMGILGFSFYIISVLVWEKRNKNYERYFSYSGLMLGFMLAMSWPGMYLPLLPSLLLIISFFLTYSLGLVAFLYFSFHFPTSTFSEKSTNIIRNHIRKPNPVNRRKLQWILWGIFLGTFPFIFLWDIPHIFNLHPFVPEWITNLALLIIPISIAIAMLRYRLFDIEIVLSRSLIYSLIIIILVGVYVFSVGGLSLVVFNELSFQSPILSIFAALIIALIFNPLRSNVQNFVNKKFFRISYDRFMSLQTFTHDLENSSEAGQLLNELKRHFHRDIPLTHQRFLVHHNKEWQIFNPIEEPCDDLLQWLQKEDLYQDEQILINIRKLEKIENNLSIVTADIPLPWIVMITIGNYASWFLREKSSGMRFWKEDLDLATQMAKATHQRWEKLDYIFQKQKEVERIQAAKMESLRRLVAGVAHEINTPIGAISSSSDVSNRAIFKLKDILDKGHFDEKLAKHLANKALTALENSNKNNLIASERIAKIVANLKKFARLDEAKYQMADVNECIESASCLIAAEVENRITIRRDYGDLPEIYCSPSSLNQVFMALFKNSMEAIKDKGEIKIRTFLNEDDINIEIIDNGNGIPQENISVIFEVGFTTKGVKVGVGLGLSICYIIIVAEHKGNIDVSSELGKGTTVTITLPRHIDYENIGIA
jgi:signal transduction histidine kinase